MQTLHKSKPGRPRKQIQANKFFSSSTSLQEVERIRGAIENEEPILSEKQLEALTIKILSYKPLLEMKRKATGVKGQPGRMPEIQDAIFLSDIAKICSNDDLQRAQKLLGKISGYSDDRVARGGSAPLIERLARAGLEEINIRHAHTFRRQAQQAKKYLF